MSRSNNYILIYFVLLFACNEDSLITQRQLYGIDICYDTTIVQCDKVYSYIRIKLRGPKDELNKINAAKARMVIGKEKQKLVIFPFIKKTNSSLSNTLTLEIISNSNYRTLKNYFSKSQELYDGIIKIEFLINNSWIVYSTKCDYEPKLFLNDKEITPSLDTLSFDSLDYISQHYGQKFIFQSKYFLYDFIEVEEPQKPSQSLEIER